MKFSTIFLTAASFISMASSVPTKRDDESIKLWVESPGQSLDRQGISPKHEGAGFSYVFFGRYTSEDIYYDSEKSEIYYKAGDIKLPFSVADGIGQFTSADTAAVVKFVDDYVTIDGESHIFAGCYNINDPYKISEAEYALTFVTKDIPNDCEALRLRKGY